MRGTIAKFGIDVCHADGAAVDWGCSMASRSRGETDVEGGKQSDAMCHGIRSKIE